MSVRKREWTTGTGQEKSAWIVNYRDASGERCQETFKTKAEATARNAEVTMGKSTGLVVAPSRSPTIKRAGELWHAAGKAADLERATLLQYRQHLDRHIVPLIGAVKLAEFTAPMLASFEQKLRSEGRSASMVGKVRVTLSSILSHAQAHGMVGRNIVRELGRQKKRGKAMQKTKLKAGVDIPLREEIAAIVAHAKGRWRPLLITAAFTGLPGFRASWSSLVRRVPQQAPASRLPACRPL